MDVMSDVSRGSDGLPRNYKFVVPLFTFIFSKKPPFNKGSMKNKDKNY